MLDARWSRPGAAGRGGRRRRGRLHRAGLAARASTSMVALEDEVRLVMHLRMTGQPAARARGRGRARAPPPARADASSSTARARAVHRPAPVRHGHRAAGRRGAATTTSPPGSGVEPLSPEFTAEALRELAAGRRAPVKAFLLSQERIAGVGNIYADEALWRSRIHPLRPVGTLKRPQLAALRDAVVESLEAGIDAEAPRSTTSATPTGPAAASRTAFRCTGARASRARAAARRSARCAPPAAGPTCARAASRGRDFDVARRLRLTRVRSRGSALRSPLRSCRTSGSSRLIWRKCCAVITTTLAGEW